MSNKAVCITQARMTSSRLPGKIMKEVNGRPLLSYHVERLKEIEGVDEIIIATTTNDTDDIVAEYARKVGVSCHRGSETDVLARYYDAAVEAGADLVLRVTSDCPVLDPALHSQLIRGMREDPSIDGYSIEIESFCRGMDGEMFTMELLRMAHENARDPQEREHVTKYFYNNFNRYNWKVIRNSRANISHLRLCVDTLEDFLELERVINILDQSPKDYSWENLVMRAY